MAVYQYMAKDTAGRKFCGVYTDVESVRRLRQELDKIGYVLLKARREKATAVKRGKIKRAEVVTFAYKFSGMYAAGLPIINCLEVLQDQTENPAFRYIISDIRQSVQTGSSLRDACAKYPAIFSNFFVGMVGAGESSGNLAVTLEKSAAYLEKREDIRRRVLSAFAYPAAVTTMCFVAVTFILTFVMPTFIDLYKQVHAPLPGPTRALIGLSWVVGHYWPVILAVAGAAVLFVERLAKKPSVRIHWDAFKLHAPLFAGLNRMLVVSHFTRTFAMLTSVGIPLIEALDVAAAVAHNHRLTKIADELKQMIKAGISVAQSLQNFRIFPTVITQLAASGEQSGQLPQMLNKGADLIDKEIDAKITSLLAKLEPLLTVAMGLVVGLILIGAYLPLFDYMGHLLEPGAQ
jgi:type IV pilus assembly protein PilC